MPSVSLWKKSRGTKLLLGIRYGETDRTEN